METGLAAVDALQPENALGTERIHGVDDHCLWHTDAIAAHGTASRRPCGPGACWFHRDLLDYADSCGRTLLFPRGLAQGNSICRGTCAADASVLRTRRKLPGARRLAHVVANPIAEEKRITCSG